MSPTKISAKKTAFVRALGNRSGFTLIELLVAIVLLSMVTLVVAMALKIAIESWERGAEEGEDLQVWVAIPALMEKQLSCLVKNDPFKDGTGGQLPFCGQKHAFSFFSSYAPQGSPWQGLLQIAYLFNEDEKTLYLFEQAITRKEDLNAKFNPLSDNWGGTFKSVSQVSGITAFNVSYMGSEKQDTQEILNWDETWKCVSTSLPASLSLDLQIGEGSKARIRKWYFRLGRTLP